MGVERRRPVRPRDKRTERQTWNPAAELCWLDRLDERRHACLPVRLDQGCHHRRARFTGRRWLRRQTNCGVPAALLLPTSDGVGAEARAAQVPTLFGALCHNVVGDATGTFDCSLAAL